MVTVENEQKITIYILCKEGGKTMGFYDDEFSTEQKTRRPGRFSIFFTGLVGAIIGGMIVLMLMPSLMKSGYVLQAEKSQNQNTTTSTSATPVSTQSVQIASTIESAVKKTENTVVGVINLQQNRGFLGMSIDGNDGNDGNNGITEQGTGSGIIFRKENGKAYIVTNNHVIEGADKVEVSLAKGSQRVKANIVGADPITDLAVLEINDNNVDQVAEFGDSSKLQVGEPAIAIGNPLGMEFSRTVTQGIISSTDRTMPTDINNDGQTDYETNVIQTDAAINPGNSGGPLINAAGQVIGINSSKIAQTGVEGLGFAIPINDAVKIIDDLIHYHSVQRPYMGIEPVDLQQISTDDWKSTLKLPDSVQSGVIIRSVEPNGPAERAGLKMYDVIVKLDGQTIENSAELRKYLFKKNVGDTVTVDYYREGKLKTAKIKLIKQEI
jgi:serine protease Do